MKRFEIMEAIPEFLNEFVVCVKKLSGAEVTGSLAGPGMQDITVSERFGWCSMILDELSAEAEFIFANGKSGRR